MDQPRVEAMTSLQVQVLSSFTLPFKAFLPRRLLWSSTPKHFSWSVLGMVRLCYEGHFPTCLSPMSNTTSLRTRIILIGMCVPTSNSRCSVNVSWMKNWMRVSKNSTQKETEGRCSTLPGNSHFCVENKQSYPRKTNFRISNHSEMHITRYTNHFAKWKTKAAWNKQLWQGWVSGL